MQGERRFFLRMLVRSAIFVGAALLDTQAAKPAHRPSGQFPQNLPPPSPPVVPPAPGRPSKAQLSANQREIKKDVDRLFSLAQDLKEQAGKTDTVMVLSVAFVQKTEEIEKLAKKIRDLARY